MLHRAVAALLVSVLAGCRPAVEEQVLCGVLGDLACPTGFRCGELSLCEPGENPPRARILEPSENEEVRDTFPVVVEVSSPLGIAEDCYVALEPQDGAPRGRTEAPCRWSPDDELGLTGVLESSVVGSRIGPPGRYLLHVEVSTRDRLRTTRLSRSIRLVD